MVDAMAKELGYTTPLNLYGYIPLHYYWMLNKFSKTSWLLHPFSSSSSYYYVCPEGEITTNCIQKLQRRGKLPFNMVSTREVGILPFGTESETEQKIVCVLFVLMKNPTHRCLSSANPWYAEGTSVLSGWLVPT